MTFFVVHVLLDKKKFCATFVNIENCRSNDAHKRLISLTSEDFVEKAEILNFQSFLAFVIFSLGGFYT